MTPALHLLTQTQLLASATGPPFVAVAFILGILLSLAIVAVRQALRAQSRPMSSLTPATTRAANLPPPGPSSSEQVMSRSAATEPFQFRDSESPKASMVLLIALALAIILIVTLRRRNV
jgi:hypothetical protein